jgi:hypothetical protein
VVQSSRGARFLLEATKMVWIVAGGWADELERYVPAKSFVVSSKDFPHPPGADFFEDPIVSDDLASHK